MRLAKIILPILFAVPLLWSVDADAQDVDPDADALFFTERFTETYDSLVNSYYLRRNSHHLRRHYNQFSPEEFDAISDSVIAARLQALHTTFPMTYNSEVRRFIKFYLRHMSTRLDVMLTLSEFYHPMFEDVLSRYNIPEELKYLTIVESAMNPTLTSRAGAAGLWQFMYSTGKVYDLEVNSIVDERRDPYKSTVAAARYLSDLYRVFGDWQLAIAAYNCGPGNVNKAIARSGGKRGFWQIYYELPRETRGYIPAFIAVVYVMNNYGQHGLRPEKLNLPVRTDTLMVRRDVFLRYVSEYTGVPIEELRTLNPQYRVDYIPSSGGPYTLCLPAARIERFIAMQDTIYSRSTDSIARRPLKVSPSQGRRSSGSSGAVYYTVRKGDNLSKIASKHGISVATLKKRNGIKGDNIHVGQRLRIK